jgi:hypothetical protein
VCEAGSVRIHPGKAVGPALVAAILLAVLTWSGAAGASGRTSAATLYREALATTRSWSVHYASDGTVSHVSILESGDAGPASGVQEVLVGKGTTLSESASLVVIGGITYVKGNAQALVDLAGLSATEATANAGKWVQFATDDQAFAQVVVGVRSHDIADELALKAPYTLGSPRRIDGYSVDAIRGTQHFQGLKTMRAILYVRAEGRHFPVEENTVNAQGRPNGVEHTVYSKWGERVRPKAPLATVTIGPVSVA